MIYVAQNTSGSGSSFLQKKYIHQESGTSTFDYYTLVLTWSPTYCMSPKGRKNTHQCSRDEKSKHSFVLHGLWPQFENGYPEKCFTLGDTFVPQSVIEYMADIMPNPQLVIHEYNKHGRCSGLSATDYFKTSRDLFFSVKIPDQYVVAEKSQIQTVEKLKQDFVNQNPSLSQENIAVSCSRGSKAHLVDLRICFSNKLVPAPCGKNERRESLCPSEDIYIPPMR